MSFDQSRSRRRRRTSGRGGGGGGGPAPSASSSSVSSYWRVKNSSNAQSSTHLEPLLDGPSDALVSTCNAKPLETLTTQRITRYTSQSAATSPGDAYKAFPPQFGSTSPGFMNATQPHDDTFHPAPVLQIPMSKQQPSKKDMGAVDQSNSGSRSGNGMANENRWSKAPACFGIRRDSHEYTYSTSRKNVGFGPGQGRTQSVPSNPRTRAPVQEMSSQGGMQQNRPDARRWQGATVTWKNQQTSSQIMRRAERRYEVGKLTFAEKAKQRQQQAILNKLEKFRAILNKLTPQNFEKLFERVKAVNIDNLVTLSGVVSLIFYKALMEPPPSCEMWATLCFHLVEVLPNFTDDDRTITFRRLLVNHCQMVFESGVTIQEEVNRAGEESVAEQSAEEREEKRLFERRMELGNIRLIGELYRKKLISERVIRTCIEELLGQEKKDVEAVCILMSTVGEMIDHPRAKEHIDAYFNRMAKLSDDMELSAQVRVMLKDVIDSRTNKWQKRK